MSITLSPLPFAKDALAPYISPETIEYHYGKHHAAYVNKLNTLIEGTDFSKQNLTDIMLNSDGGIFNNAAQIWNDDFYWQSLSGTQPTISDKLKATLDQYFGSVEQFKEAFTASALGQFGSGWTWLVQDTAGNLEICSTSNADNPLKHGKKPLLCCDVWEHAYYIDTRNSRPDYLKNFWEIVNWAFVEQNFA